MKTELKDLPSRILFHGATLLIFFTLLYAIHFPFFAPLFALIIALIGHGALKEYYALVSKKALLPALRLGQLFSFFYLFSTYLKFNYPIAFFRFLPSIVLGLALFTFFVYFTVRWRASISPIIHIATSFLGLIYVTVPLSLLLGIASFPSGWLSTFWLGFLVLVTKSADMGAYFVGRSCGRTPLFVKLSPKKSYEGAIGGIFAAIIIALLITYVGRNLNLLTLPFTYLEAVILGIILSIAGGLGDLAESLLKRDAGVKDSNTIPGVGGLLDVLDSLLFTAPLLYIFLQIRYN